MSRLLVIGAGDLPDFDRRSEKLNSEDWEITAARMISVWLPLCDALDERDFDKDPEMEKLITPVRNIMEEAVERRSLRPGTLVRVSDHEDKYRK